MENACEMAAATTAEKAAFVAHVLRHTKFCPIPSKTFWRVAPAQINSLATWSLQGQSRWVAGTRYPQCQTALSTSSRANTSKMAAMSSSSLEGGAARRLGGMFETLWVFQSSLRQAVKVRKFMEVHSYTTSKKKCPRLHM